MKKNGRILIVDDNQELLVALEMFLRPHFELIDTLKNPNQLISRMREQAYDIVLLDMNFTAGQNTGNEGLYWMGQIQEKDPEVAVVLITAFGDVSLAVKAMKEGACDFIQKDWDEAKILNTLLATLKMQESKKKIRNLKAREQHLSGKIQQEYRMYKGDSPAMQKVLRMVEKVAATDANVLILGENGTGKEVIAREIHRLSARSEEIFVSVDLGSLTASLFESELFGYKKGAFTDAKADKQGRFELAGGGTLFLDEIGNLDMNQQAKLLSVLQNREFVRLGEVHPRPLDIRLITATNADLHQQVDDMRFREDLFYRINTIIVELPPLRERKEDIAGLAQSFLQEFMEEYRKELRFSREALSFLNNYNWPGNIRELRHLVEKGVILAEGREIEPEDMKQGGKRVSTAGIETLNLADQEKALIRRAIDVCEGNISKAAKELGINRSTLYEKMRRYELDQT